LKLFDDIGEPEQEETEIKQELEFYDLEEMAESIQLFADQDEDIYDVEYPDNQEAAMSLNSRVTNISNRYHGLQYIHNQTENGRFVNPYKKSWDQVQIKPQSNDIKQDNQPKKEAVVKPKHQRGEKTIVKLKSEIKQGVMPWLAEDIKKIDKTLWIRTAFLNYLNKYNLREDINLCIWVTNKQCNLYLYVGTRGLNFIQIPEIFTDLTMGLCYSDVQEIIINSIINFHPKLFVKKTMYLMIRRSSNSYNEIFAEMYIKNGEALEIVGKIDMMNFFKIPHHIYQSYTRGLK
jgi:hypothetical protein